MIVENQIVQLGSLAKGDTCEVIGLTGGEECEVVGGTPLTLDSGKVAVVQLATGDVFQFDQTAAVRKRAYKAAVAG